jgi:hypothetical protein
MFSVPSSKLGEKGSGRLVLRKGGSDVFVGARQRRRKHELERLREPSAS